MAWLGFACLRVGVYICMYAVIAWALLQYMLPYACRRRVEMHGTLRGELATWFGLAWLLRGWGVEADSYR